MRLLRSIFQLLLILFNLLVIYFFVTIIGLFWARNIDEPKNADGIPLMIHGDGFHTELYLPVEDSILHFNWLNFIDDSVIFHKHIHNKLISLGWAEEEWSIASTNINGNVLMAFKSLLWPWNKSIMHVQLMDTVHLLKNGFTEHRNLRTSEYQELIEFIKKGIIMRNGKPVIRSYQGYNGYDYFFSSNRRYNALNTCNQWTADALNSCGIRNPCFAPFGWSIRYQVKK